MSYYLWIIWLIASIGTGFLFGISIPYVLNRIPARWLADYDEEPTREMWGERIKEKPWRMVFGLLFIAFGLKLMDQGPIVQLAALMAIWFLVLIGISDGIFQIIPDQLVVALGATGLGLIGTQPSFLSPLYGSLLGGGTVLLIGLLGKGIWRKDVIGFGDVKLLAAAGLLSGFFGMVWVLLGSFLVSGLFLGVRLLTGRISVKEEVAMGPFIAASLGVYLLFRPELMWLAYFLEM